MMGVAIGLERVDLTKRDYRSKGVSLKEEDLEVELYVERRSQEKEVFMGADR